MYPTPAAGSVTRLMRLLKSDRRSTESSMAMFRKVLAVAVTGAASAAAFSAAPPALPLAQSPSARLRAAIAPRNSAGRTASLSLEMARVPLMAGNWKMNPTSVTEVRCGGPYPCLPGCVCVPPLQCFSGGPGISPFQDPQQVGCRPGGGVRLWMGWMLCGYRGCEQVSS